jgi:hypothetical protein
MQTGHTAHHAATSTLTDSTSWGDNNRVVCVGVKNWSEWEIGKKHQQQVPELTVCVIKGAVGPVQDEPLAHFIVGSHLRSHLNIDMARDEMDIGTMLDTNVSPSNCLTITGHHSADMYIPQLYFERAEPQFHGFDHGQQQEVQSNNADHSHCTNPTALSPSPYYPVSTHKIPTCNLLHSPWDVVFDLNGN